MTTQTENTMSSDYSKVRPDVIESIRLYVDGRCPTGGFLEAVLSNDLKGAVRAADEQNLATLVDIVRYCYWEIPGDCWGSPARVREWLNPEGDEGR
jgi:hypothetical protein